MAVKRKCCTKDTVFTFLCSCDECSRSAAASWMTKMDRVMGGGITLDEAQRLQSTEDTTRSPVRE